MNSTLIYVHDPMCSWCYGFSATLTNLMNSLPRELEVIRLLGGLAPDTEEAMPKATQNMVKQNWQRIEEVIPGVQFNYDFWTNCKPRRATYPACRAVIAARKQGTEFDELMTRQIQLAYYQRAMNPSNDDTLLSLASDIGLDTGVFSTDLKSTDTRDILLDEMKISRSIGIDSFPSLLLKLNEEAHPVLINYTDANAMMRQIQGVLDKTG